MTPDFDKGLKQAPLLQKVWQTGVFLVVTSIVIAPLFAHGCHGDDVDHEPLIVPFKMNREPIGENPTK